MIDYPGCWIDHNRVEYLSNSGRDWFFYLAGLADCNNSQFFWGLDIVYLIQFLAGIQSTTFFVAFITSISYSREEIVALLVSFRDCMQKTLVFPLCPSFCPFIYGPICLSAVIVIWDAYSEAIMLSDFQN